MRCGGERYVLVGGRGSGRRPIPCGPTPTSAGSGDWQPDKASSRRPTTSPSSATAPDEATAVPWVFAAQPSAAWPGSFGRRRSAAASPSSATPRAPAIFTPTGRAAPTPPPRASSTSVTSARCSPAIRRSQQATARLWAWTRPRPLAILRDSAATSPATSPPASLVARAHRAGKAVDAVRERLVMSRRAGSPPAPPRDRWPRPVPMGTPTGHAWPGSADRAAPPPHLAAGLPSARRTLFGHSAARRASGRHLQPRHGGQRPRGRLEQAGACNRQSAAP